MSGTALSWSDEATKAPVAGDRFAWSDEKDEPNVGSGPVTLNQRRGGSTVTGIPRLHGSDISQGIPGAAEKRMGQGFSPSQIVRNSLRGPALGAATVAPMLTGGASIPAEMLVSGLSGAAQSKLEGGANMDAALAGGLGVAIPAALGNVPGLRNAMGRLTPPELYEPTNVWHGPDELPITNRLHGPETPAPITNVPHYPGAYPPEVIQARGLNLGGRTAPEPSAGLGKIPVRDILAERRLNPPAATETPRSEGDLFTRQFFSSKPAEDVGGAARAKVQAQQGPLPRTSAPEFRGPRITPSTNAIRQEMQIPHPTADTLEDRALQEQMREDLEKHGQAAGREGRRRQIAGSSTGITKGELTGANQIAKPAVYTKTPGISVRGVNVVPQANEDLTDLLTRSLKQAKGEE